MGEPKFSRPRTQTPTHPWKQARIDEEHDLKERYGLKKVGGMREKEIVFNILKVCVLRKKIEISILLLL